MTISPAIARRGLTWPAARLKRIPPQPEKHLQSKVLELAYICGWRAYHTYDSRRSAAGFPDLILVRNGQMLAVELKAERGNVTADQRMWLDELALVPGVRCFVFKPSDWSGIVRVLQEAP
jgi:hypothetical protein